MHTLFSQISTREALHMHIHMDIHLWKMCPFNKAHSAKPYIVLLVIIHFIFIMSFIPGLQSICRITNIELIVNWLMSLKEFDLAALGIKKMNTYVLNEQHAWEVSSFS